MVIFLSLLVAVAGLVIYVLNENKMAELGRIMFFSGLFVFLMGAEQAVTFFR